MVKFEIGNIIRFRRKELNLKQKEVAESAGVSVTIVSNLENNKLNTTLKNLKKICVVLDLQLVLKINNLFF